MQHQLGDTVTYEEVLAVLQAVSADYAHGGESGGLSAPAHEVIQAVWTQLKGLPVKGSS